MVLDQSEKPSKTNFDLMKSILANEKQLGSMNVLRSWSEVEGRSSTFTLTRSIIILIVVHKLVSVD